METKYPTLRRPKRKLCYFTNKESPSKEWTEPLTLGDIDRMFDDLDPSSRGNDDLLPPSPLLQTSDSEANQSERETSPIPQEEHLMEKLPRCQMGSEGDVLHPATRSPSPKLDVDLDFPFKAHGPVKTSSPIEENMVVQDVEELENEKDQVVSPILFACEDEGKEEAKTEPLPTQKTQCNELITEESDDFELDSPPSKVALSKPKMSSHKNKVEGSCKESHPVKEKIAKKPQTAVVEGKRKAPRQENTDPPVSAVRQTPGLAAPKKNSGSAHRQPPVEVSTRVGKDMTAFLQKLRDAGQPKPACSQKSLSPIKVPTPPPEPEDDFLILEDDTPLWFSIPSKTATSKRQKQSRTSSTDKDSSTDKGTNDSPLETAQKQQESEQDNRKLGSQTVNQKMKKTKGKDKKNEVTKSVNDKDEFCGPEDLPAGDLMEQEKPNKKKQRLKKVPSKESDKAEEQPKDTASRETGEEKPTLKMEKKAQKSSDAKRSTSLKDGNENAKTRRAKSLNGNRKVTQGSDAIKETVYVEAVKEQSQSSEEHADAEDLGSHSDKEIMNFEAHNNNKHNKLLDVPEGSLSEDSQILGKRKRRQTGQWWLSRPQSTEETKVTDNQPTLKKSKQNNKKPSTAVPSSVKTKKDRVLLKRRNQTQTALSSSQNTNKAKEKKTKQNKNRNTRGDTSDKIKATDKVYNAIEAEQIEAQQQEILNQDPDLVQSSPLDLTHRDHNLNSGDQVFQRVYHHVSNEKMSVTPTPVSPRRPREQLRTAEPGKRRRKPPSNWWTVDGMSEVVESISSQPQQPKPKERKKRSKMSRSPALGTPKKGNTAVSSKPLGGTPVPHLKVKPLSAPKTVKRSLATFKNIFTSVTETPTVVSSRAAGQNISKTNKDVLSMDAGESNSPPNHETPQDSKCQSENMLQALISGPSSMIELEQYEENDDLILPSSRVHAVLSVSDLCAPPLKPLILQPKDKANLTEWFKSLWSATVDNGSEITPDQFDWYFYQGRAIGFLVDLNCGSICNGKILLGSYMKKPLWVDHSATTVFNLLTSSVSVTIDGSESRFNPGQSFMVKCGHAYSIQNVTAQPAVLYFTRILAESSD
ncbi:uncharacterized protein si:ch211-161h7.4 isoform X2 [Siniperca chuatsi]|uniref:uncharacterized protein si:ch211-161h7.4 isoform X2 n=1 Tax=Siniperca chuatsi TaxID=119488 RepID=UPI001CE0696F|nr:uncharacterized protein si:ch211-161h7.4 isoform X2 [Siniperca chuatsi]